MSIYVIDLLGRVSEWLFYTGFFFENRDMCKGPLSPPGILPNTSKGLFKSYQEFSKVELYVNWLIEISGPPKAFS